LFARLRQSSTTRVTRSLCTAAALASARAGGSLSVKQRLRETTVPPEVLKRIRKLGMGHERGGAVRVSEEDLRKGRKRELGRMGLIKSAQTMDQLPPAAVAELALAGRSNVGKSSLLNALVGKRSAASTTRGLAPVQNRPGVTRALNFYGSERRGARIVDMPGYGFAFAPEDAPGKWQEAMQEYVQVRAPLFPTPPRAWSGSALSAGLSLAEPWQVAACASLHRRAPVAARARPRVSAHAREGGKRALLRGDDQVRSGQER